jgi:Tfp pilus assembly protein PilX
MSKRVERDSLITAGRSRRKNEQGAALATSLLIMSALAAVSMTVLAVVTHEARIAGSDLKRTQTYYATAAGIEKMTNDFSDLFTKTASPTTTQINNVAAAYPSELVSDGFTFTKADGSPNQSIVLDPGGTSQNVGIQSGPFAGLNATVTPYILTSTATHIDTGTQVTLQRTINNFLIPIFQFGMFSNEDL